VGNLLFSAKQANAMILSYDKSTAKYLHYGEIVRCRSVGYFKLCVAGQAEGTLWWRPGKQLGSGPPCMQLGYLGIYLDSGQWTVDSGHSLDVGFHVQEYSMNCRSIGE